MSKELYVSSTPHETKVAVVEDDQLAEIYFERENEYTLAGSIYKGRVTRVLPGMQSAFVNIGLERDAFLYVSDFFEMEDEDEQIEPVNVRAHRNAVGAFPEPQQPRPEQDRAPHSEGAPAMEFTGGYDEPSEAPAQSEGAGEDGEGGARRWRGRRRRRGGRRGRGMPEAKFAEGEARPEGEEPS
ncbi:MAG TPA: ribonuclease, partial [Terriglobales bacterium]|nr:ribonuclease [Terriglobales bacterium]